MRRFFRIRLAWAAVIALSIAAGCSRTTHRLKADNEAYNAIAERNADPRWQAATVSIEPDPRSRFYEPYHQDCPPMPWDDPSSHQYMRQVNGKRGFEHWYDNGARIELENTGWRESLGQYVEITESGAVKLNIDSALKLAYLHSRVHQRQLETLYLSALDVVAERFRLNTQYFAGYDIRYDHRGELIPATLGFSPLAGRFVTTSPVRAPGVENNRLTLGRPFAQNPVLAATRRFSTAGDLLVGFANSFVFEFTGGDANLSSSLVNFSLIQPLLRGAGRDIALEQLTLAERRLLANLRAYSQFRQGFYTQIVIGELGVTGPQRFGGNTSLQSFSGSGFVSGYFGLLQQTQQIRNANDNLDLQLRTLERLEALFKQQFIDPVQVDQFRQSIEDRRADLLDRNNSLQLALDNYKTNTLGLPPNLPIDVDAELIEQFQLIPREAAPIQQSLLDLRRRLSKLPDTPDVDVLQKVLTEAGEQVEPVKKLFAQASQALRKMEEVVPTRERTMTSEQKARFKLDREELTRRWNDLQTDKERGYDAAVAKLKTLESGLNENTKARTLGGTTAWVGAFLEIVERLSLVLAQARLETIMVEPVRLEAEEAFRIAIENRLDFMNGRAALVDRWRAIQVASDALQSVLNLTAGGDVRTAKNNPLNFRAATGSFRAGLQFDAPITRVLERNAYREALIEYQRARREFIFSRDVLEKGLRAVLRNLEQRRQQLEIQRRAIKIALRRVDQTQLLLSEPPPELRPGQGRPTNPTTAINLLGAQGALQGTQNQFLSAWFSFHAARLRLYRELGVMQLDPEGRWIEQSIDGPLMSDPLVPPGPEAPGRPDPMAPPKPLPEDPMNVRPMPLKAPQPVGWAEINDTAEPASRVPRIFKLPRVLPRWKSRK